MDYIRHIYSGTVGKVNAGEDEEVPSSNQFIGEEEEPKFCCFPEDDTECLDDDDTMITSDKEVQAKPMGQVVRLVPSPPTSHSTQNDPSQDEQMEVEEENLEKVAESSEHEKKEAASDWCHSELGDGHAGKRMELEAESHSEKASPESMDEKAVNMEKEVAQDANVITPIPGVPETEWERTTAFLDMHGPPTDQLEETHKPQDGTVHMAEVMEPAPLQSPPKPEPEKQALRTPTPTMATPQKSLVEITPASPPGTPEKDTSQKPPVEMNPAPLESPPKLGPEKQSPRTPTPKKDTPQRPGISPRVDITRLSTPEKDTPQKPLVEVEPAPLQLQQSPPKLEPETQSPKRDTPYRKSPMEMEPTSSPPTTAPPKKRQRRSNLTPEPIKTTNAPRRSSRLVGKSGLVKSKK